ncbi:tRNA pseudouridine(55) synthase TruB [Tundrisphaera lichenicola]|uniref:tRNA pseudouridine(55) synthase TruB n=1 Tax=Tundrisphaera lichenicola TaxID=2029860 RepID=UPI003EBA052C
MSSPDKGRLSGLLNLEKPSGVTSRDVVDLISRPLRKVKVGHAGTLDPLASGVLVVCVGAATRLIEYVQRMPKAYRTVVRLGARSDTLDADGQIEIEANPRIPSLDEVLAALASQIGLIEQIPPQFSALKVEGRRAYDLARSGQAVELAARPVRVDRVDLISYEWPRLEFTVDCGSGTYIRSIARDVGEILGCGGLIEVLIRTRIGPFLQSEAIDPTGLPIETILNGLRPSLDALGELTRVAITNEQVEAVLMGKGLSAERIPGTFETRSEVALVGPDGALVAVAEVTPHGSIQPRRVLATASPS